MFEINGKNYVLKYNLKRVELIENAGAYILENILCLRIERRRL